MRLHDITTNNGMWIRALATAIVLQCKTIRPLTSRSIASQILNGQATREGYSPTSQTVFEGIVSSDISN